jgi:hypothetical protein
MDNFVTLIVVIIIIVSAISRIKTAQKPKAGAKPAPPSDLGSKLKAFFAEVQQRLEEQAPDGPSRASRWDGLSNADPTKSSSAPSYEMSLDDLELEYEEAQPTPEPVKKPSLRPAMTPTRPQEKLPDSGRPRLCAPEAMPAKAAPCPEFLRRAVVWSEILGPPVALRDSSRQR